MIDSTTADLAATSGIPIVSLTPDIPFDPGAIVGAAALMGEVGLFNPTALDAITEPTTAADVPVAAMNLTGTQIVDPTLGGTVNIGGRSMLGDSPISDLVHRTPPGVLAGTDTTGLTPVDFTPPPEPPAIEPEEALGSPALTDLLVADDNGNVTTVTKDEIVASALLESGMSIAQWNSLHPGDRNDLLTGEIAYRTRIIKSSPAPVSRPDGIHSRVIEVEHARALPEIDATEPTSDAVYAPGSIEHFVDETSDLFGKVERRVMRIVVDVEGKLRKLFHSEA